jgi:putative transposon-encoded protein
MRGETIFEDAKPIGNGAMVLVPKRWLGWRIKCLVVRRARLENED